MLEPNQSIRELDLFSRQLGLSSEKFFQPLRMSLPDGDLAVLDDLFSFREYNNLLKSFAGAGAIANPQAGVIQFFTGTTLWRGWDGAVWHTLNLDLSVSPRDSETKNANYILLEADGGKTIEMNNAAARIFTLTTAGTLGKGWWVRLVKKGAGKVTIQAPGAETIADSSGGGTLFNDISIQAGWANVIIEVDFDEGGFSIIGGQGLWLTT